MNVSSALIMVPFVTQDINSVREESTTNSHIITPSPVCTFQVAPWRRILSRYGCISSNV